MERRIGRAGDPGRAGEGGDGGGGRLLPPGLLTLQVRREQLPISTEVNGNTRGDLMKQKTTK